MLDFHEKRRLRGILFSKVTIALLVGLTVLLTLSAHERFVAARDAAEKRAERALELERLKLRAAALEAQVEYIESDHGIEAEIREKFDVARPNEKVVVVVGDEAAGAAALSALEEAPEPEPPSLWRQILFFWR